MQYKTCKLDEGGKPKCGLGCRSDLRTIEVRGASFDQIYAVQNSKQTLSRNRTLTLDREYDVVIVLEAPGEAEDIKGVPTVGRAGKKMTDFIIGSGLESRKVYVTNIVKCRPPKNRNPQVKEIKACLPHLEYEIRRIQPKVIICLGNKALRLFNLHNKGGIFKIRGNVYNAKLPSWPDGPTFKVIPTFHPSYFLHTTNEQAERRCQDDYNLAAKLARGEEIEKKRKSTYRLIHSKESLLECIEEMKQSSFVAFDTESRALDYKEEPMLCFSFCWGYDADNPGKQTAVLPITRHSETPNSLGWNVKPFWGIGKRSSISESNVLDILKKEIFENTDIAKAAHNLKYDMLVLRQWANTDIKGTLYDTLLMAHLLREQKPHNLEYLADLEFSTGDYSAKLTNITGKGKKLLKPYDCIPDKILWPYAALDAENVYRLCCLYHYRFLARTLDEKVPNQKLRSYYINHVQPAIRTFAEVEWDGIKIDKELAEEVKDNFEKEQERLLSSLRLSTNNPNFNPSSIPDVRNAIIKAGFEKEIKDPDKPTGYTVDKNKLRHISDKWPTAELIIDYRTNKKMISTYLEHSLDDLGRDGRIRKSFMLNGTESGRLSCSFLHQVPRKFGIRDLFIPEEGYLYGYMDYSRIELKVFAILVKMLTGDSSLYNLHFDPNIDAHKTMASIILGIPQDKISDDNRQVGKTANFAIMYGSEGYELVKQEYDTLNGNKRIITWNMVERGMNEIHKKFPSVREYHNLIVGTAISQQGIIINAYGRERHMGNQLIDANTSIRNAARREVVNFTIQSVASQIMVDTMSILHKKIQDWVKKGLLKRSNIKIINTVHDSCIVEFREALRNWTLKLMKNTAERPIPQLENNKFSVDLGVGDSWSQAEVNKIKI